MESEARDGAAGGSRGTVGEDGTEDALPEAERLRRENRRLEARLAVEERRRERLIDRYEALLPDGSAADAESDGERDGAGVEHTTPDTGAGATASGRGRGVASAAGRAVWAAFAWGRRRLREVRARR